MNRYNSELPKVYLPEHKVNYFAPRFLLGYLFLLCTFILAVVLIYQIQASQQAREKAEANNGQVCVQVITAARNPISGEVSYFPTPCDVPDGWTLVNPN